MSKLLYIQASPLQEISYSIRAADAFIEAYKQKNPADTVETINVFEASLPEFDGPAARAKYAIMHGREHTAEQIRIWKNVQKVIEQFTGADKYLMAVPMWNLSIPYKLKQYFDLIVQPGYTFNYSDETGYQGLVTGKPILAVYARGGRYENGSGAEAFDLQTKYLELILGFIGFRDIVSLVIEPTLQEGPDAAETKLKEIIGRAKKIAVDF